MPTGLDASQRAVEQLYHDVVMKNGLLDDEDECTCRCQDRCVCDFLRDRIKKNLRMVLCDMVSLRLVRGNAIMEDE